MGHSFRCYWFNHKIVHRALTIPMEQPIFQIAAGVLLGGFLLMSFCYGARAASQTENFTDLSFWENVSMLIPLLFLIYNFWLYL